MLHAVILAGGSGTRLWPESRADRPKQFLRLFDEETLIANTVKRIGPVIPQDRVLFATGQSFLPLLQESFPNLAPRQLLLEPVARNTAPCIGLAAIRLLRDDPDATMIVLPADHLIRPEQEFCRILRFAGRLIEQFPDRLITLGIKPTFPATTYGYIEQGEEQVGEGEAPVFSVKRFYEKPALALATEFFESGRFFWNSGIFIWKARTILQELRTWEPELGERLEKIADNVISPHFPEILEKEFSAMKSISIDYAVLERSPDVCVVETSFDWDDVGTWSSLARVYTDRQDENGNVAIGGTLLTKNARNNLIRSTDPDRQIALIGVENLIVVQTETTTLIVPKEYESEIQALKSDIES